MTVPSYQAMMLPLLTAISEEGGETYMAIVSENVSAALGLTDDDKSEMLASGQQSIFINRLHWAKTYMQRAGFIRSTRRGYFEITDRGNEVLRKELDKIDNGYLAQFQEFVDWKAGSKTQTIDLAKHSSSVDDDQTPEDKIEQNFQQINGELATELLDRIISSTPAFFEELIVQLLLAMGYGGGRSEMGKALGRSNDGGIDGIINEDQLGLDAIYIQAKRYSRDNAVTISSVRDFVGSLEGFQATKGIFVTTSYFPKSATDYVSKISKRVVLIDGPQLADLMIRYNVGTRTKGIFEIKKIDEEFFIG